MEFGLIRLGVGSAIGALGFRLFIDLLLLLLGFDMRIETDEAKHGLKNVFDKIFAKYGRTFDDDDEIDLDTLQVVKSTGHLENLPKLQFGSAYRRHKRSALLPPEEFEGPFGRGVEVPDEEDPALAKALDKALALPEEDIFEMEFAKLHPDEPNSRDKTPVPPNRSRKRIREVVESEEDDPLIANSLHTDNRKLKPIERYPPMTWNSFDALPTSETSEYQRKEKRKTHEDRVKTWAVGEHFSDAPRDSKVITGRQSLPSTPKKSSVDYESSSLIPITSSSGGLLRKSALKAQKNIKILYNETTGQSGKPLVNFDARLLPSYDDQPASLISSPRITSRIKEIPHISTKSSADHIKKRSLKQENGNIQKESSPIPPQPQPINLNAFEQRLLTLMGVERLASKPLASRLTCNRCFDCKLKSIISLVK